SLYIRYRDIHRLRTYYVQHAPSPTAVRTLRLHRSCRLPAAGTVAADLGHDPGRAGRAGPVSQGTRAIGCATGAGTRGVHAPGDVVTPRGADVDRSGDPGASSEGRR